MNRRKLLTLLAALPLAAPGAAQAYEAEQFGRAVWDRLETTDTPTILNFRASWSLTCQLKAEMIDALLARDPVYQSIPIVDVNWDQYGPSEWTKNLGVTQRSTLVVVKARKEIARIESQPYPHKIKALFDVALGA